MRLYTLLTFPLVLLSLTGCVTGGGFGTWNGGKAQSPAQQAPQATSQAQTPPSSDQPPVKVALLVPLSGRNASLGQSMLNAAQMALFDIGSTNFELLPQDTKGTAEGASTAASEAVANGAQLILGPLFAEEVQAAKPAARNAHINMIAFSTSWSLADDNTFLMGFMPFDQVERIASYAVSKNLKSIGVIAPPTEYGRAVASAFGTASSRLGAPVVQSLSLAPEKMSAADLQSFARAARYNAVFMPYGGSAAATVSGALSQAGLSVRRLGTGLLDDPALATKPEMNGAWFAAPPPAQSQAFNQRFNAAYDYTPPRLATLAYDATALAASLAQQGYARSGAPAFDRASITNPNGFAGLDGIFRFRPNGLAERGLAVLEYNNGRAVVIDPAPQTFQ